MAGWKLRKDKTQSETGETVDTEDAHTTSELDSSPPGAEVYALPTAEDDAEPASRWEMPEEDWQTPPQAIVLSPVEDEPETEHETQHETVYPQPKFFDLSGDPLSTPDLEMPDDAMETGEALHFAEDEEGKEEDPIVLADYTCPIACSASPTGL